MMALNAPIKIALMAALVASYVAAGKLGLGLAFVHASATAVWPPTGIALAAMLLFGYRVWPAIALGAFLVNVTTAGSIATSLGIATGNTLESLLGVWLVNRFAGGRHVFERAVDVFKFLGLVAALSTAVSATIGVTSLALGGFASWSDYAAIWLTWWLGDAVGALVITPAIVLWVTQPRPRWDRARLFEAGALLAAIIVVGEGVFGSVLQLHPNTYPLDFAGIGVIVWTAFRFGPREAATALVLLATLALLGTLHNTGPFAVGSPHESLVLLQAFMGTLSAITLPMAAVVWERRRTEQELNQSELAYREMFENNPHPMWITDRETLRFLAVNEAAVRHYGYPRAEFLAMSTLDIRPPGEIPRVHAAIAELNRGRNSFDNYQHRTRDGRLIDVEGSIHPLMFRGRPAALVLAYDVTARKRTEEERRSLLELEQAAREAAEDANRVKDEFLATLSHELRTPLNAMLGWVTMLRSRGLDEATSARALESIERNTRLQAKIVEDLLDVSRIISGKFKLDPRPVDLVSITETVLDSVRPAADGKGIAIEAALEPTLTVRGDPARLQQIAWNLLSNAVKFTPSGGRVRVALQRTGDEAVLAVSDTGRGISPEFLPYIFERFRQAESSTTRMHGGLGLGLAITRHLVELHGGIIEARSDGAGTGATFTVRLPSMSGARATTDSAVTPPVRGGGRLDGVAVLIVDDDSDSADFLQTALSHIGAAVRAVGSAAEAFAALRRARPDVLVADIGMPGEDGYALITKIRALPEAEGGRVPAVAVTAYARTSDIERAMAAGYHAHLAKPVDVDALAATIAGLLGRGT